jgi:HlyD family secretion protein
MNKTLKWILIAVGALAIIFVVARAAMKKGNDGIRVTAETVKRRTLVETVSASGKLYPETELKVGSPINGEVTQLAVQEGDSVKKGQLLARIQGEKGGTAPQRMNLPNMPPGFEGLVQSMQQPRTSPAQTSATITAPISGTVIALNVKKGERIGAMQLPGSELLRIADMANIEVRVDVNENNIIKISVGDSADVEVEAYNKRKFKGIVTGIANGSTKKDAPSFLSNDITNYEVHIRLLPSSYADLFDSSRRRSMPFRPGMNARADIKTKRRENVVSVPVGAVVSKAKGSDDNPGEKKENAKEDEASTGDIVNTGDLEEVVYVVKNDGTVQKRVVTTGIQDINHFEISSGLREGEKVVTGPYSAVSKTLRSGQKVSVVSKEQIFQND